MTAPGARPYDISVVIEALQPIIIFSAIVKLRFSLANCDRVFKIEPGRSSIRRHRLCDEPSGSGVRFLAPLGTPASGLYFERSQIKWQSSSLVISNGSCLAQFKSPCTIEEVTIRFRNILIRAGWKAPYCVPVQFSIQRQSTSRCSSS